MGKIQQEDSEKALANGQVVFNTKFSPSPSLTSITTNNYAGSLGVAVLAKVTNATIRVPLFGSFAGNDPNPANGAGLFIELAGVVTPDSLRVESNGAVRFVIASGGNITLGNTAGVAVPTDRFIQGEPGLGTDKNGGMLTLRGGQATGTGTPAKIKLQSTSVGASSATLQTLIDALVIAAGGDIQLNRTITPAGTTGAQTINKAAGTVNFAAGASSLVVTNSLVNSNSIVIPTVRTNDTTMKSVQAVPGSGSFTLFPNANPTAETSVGFLVLN